MWDTEDEDGPEDDHLYDAPFINPPSQSDSKPIDHTDESLDGDKYRTVFYEYSYRQTAGEERHKVLCQRRCGKCAGKKETEGVLYDIKT